MINKIGSKRAKWFAVLDLTSGYHQAPIDEVENNLYILGTDHIINILFRKSQNCSDSIRLIRHIKMIQQSLRVTRMTLVTRKDC